MLLYHGTLMRSADTQVFSIHPTGQVSTFSYDAQSRRIGLSLPNCITTTYSYDDASQLLSLVYQLAGDPQSITGFAYAYNKVGNNTSLNQQRSAIAVNPALSYVYDELNRLVQATHPLPAMANDGTIYVGVGNLAGRICD